MFKVKVEPPTTNLTHGSGLKESLSSHFQVVGEEEVDEGVNEVDTWSLSNTNRTELILQAQLDVIFLLRNVLQLPISQLERYLKIKGDPQGWIVLCDSCKQLVKNVREIFLQLQSLSRKYNEARVKVEERIKLTSSLVDVQLRNDFILEDCRRTVCRRHTTSSTSRSYSFLEGDRRALQLLKSKQDRGKEVDKGQVPLEVMVELDKTLSHIHIPPRPCSGNPEDPARVNSPMRIEEDDPLSNCHALDDHHSLSSSPSYRPTPCSSPASFIPSVGGDEDYQLEEDQDSVDGVDRDQVPLQQLKKRKMSSSSNASLPIQENTYSGKGSKSPVKKDGLHTCHICRKVLTSNQVLRIHLHRIHKIEMGERPLRTFKCTVEGGCGKEFFEKYRFLKHIKWHENVPKCETCKKSYKTQFLLDKHDLYKHKIVKPTTQNLKFFDCPKCDHRFPNEDLLKSHSKTCSMNGEDIDPGNIFPCPHCGKSYVGRRKLSEHIRQVHTQGPGPKFECSMCLKKFFRPEKVRLHMAKCHDIGTENYKCFECGKFYNTKDGRRRHTCGEPDILCEICGLDFKDKYRLKVHMTTHSMEKLHCDLCEYRTSRKSNLLMHKASKHQIGVKCEVPDCNQFFASEKLMENHMKLKHEKQSKWRCDLDLCDFISTRKSSLLKHKASKHQIGIKCQVLECNRFFPNGKTLDEHLKRIHPQGEKEMSFVCTDCGKGFYNQMDLRKHVQAMHSSNRETKPYKCKLCGKGFATAGYRAYHMKTHRKQEIKATVTSSN